MMGTQTLHDPAPGISALQGLLADLAAADELITELVAQNDQLRARLTATETNHHHPSS